MARLAINHLTQLPAYPSIFPHWDFKLFLALKFCKTQWLFFYQLLKQKGSQAMSCVRYCHSMVLPKKIQKLFGKHFHLEKFLPVKYIPRCRIFFNVLNVPNVLIPKVSHFHWQSFNVLMREHLVHILWWYQMRQESQSQHCSAKVFSWTHTTLPLLEK